ncbi:hypothetical protein J6590_074032 [Homalodisca vitripennis]|nr:hypothetical protein J6590_074032 [Homalodisca vitripennis]
MFEEHDIKQSEILPNYSLKINEQEKLIAKLKNSAEKSHTNVIKTPVYVGPQTIHINSPPTNVTLLIDLSLIKEKQDQMVQSITELNRNLENIAITIPLMTEDPGSKTSLTEDSSLSTTPKPTELTGGISQTPTKKLSTTDQTRIFYLSTTPQATESTGTWTKKEVLLDTRLIGYKLVAEFSRTTFLNGGVAIYAKELLQEKIEAINVHDQCIELLCEVAVVKIKIGKITTFIIGVYRTNKNLVQGLEIIA